MHAHIVGGELIATKEMLRKSEMEVADLKIKLEAAQKQFTAELSAAREGLEQTKIALAQETTKAVEMTKLYHAMEAKKEEAFLNGLERGFNQGKAAASAK